MRKHFGIFAAVLTLAAGCAKEISPSGNELITELTAGVAPTRTVLEGSKVYWTAGDKINVNGVVSNELAIDGPSATATFTFKGDLNPPYKAVFPASVYKDENTVTMPSVQEYCETSFHSQASPMLAYSKDNGNLAFSHPFAVVCLSINLKEDSDKISYVEFRGNYNEQVCGDFTVDFDELTLTGAGAYAANKSVRVNVGQSLPAEGTMLVHIVVPAQTYSKGFTVKVADENGHYMQKSVETEKVYSSGVVYDMTAFDFEPTDTEVRVEITSAAELIEFATKWNAGEYTSTAENPLVVNLTQNIEFTAENNAAWPGIGNTSDTAFAGQFNGNGNSISGFTSSTSLFPYIGADAAVSNLTIAGDVTYDLTDCDADTNVGPFATRTKGNLIGCTSAVDITLTSTNVITSKFRAGGVAGYMNGGSMTDCAYTGTIKWGEESSCDQETRIGGIVGFVESESSAVLDGCYMSGSMQFDTATGTGYWGGLFGQAKAKMVKNCFTKEEATITVANTCATRLGGIAGFASGGSFDGCVNNASITVNSPHDKSYSDVGGIVGRNMVVISNCDNAGTITITAGALTQRVGGVVGNNSGTVSSCENTGAVLADKVLTAEQTLNLAGCVASNTGTLSTLINRGDVTMNTEGWSNSDGIAVAGVVANSTTGVTKLTNTGNITVNESSENGGQALYIGGVLGWTSPTGENIATDMTVSSCENSGVVNFAMSGVLRKFDLIFVGGIVGYNPEIVSLKVTECTNSGKVTCGKLDARAKDEAYFGSKYLGGIVGYLRGKSEISDCKNSGIVHNDDDNNSTSNSTAPMTGGIVGRARGSSSTARVTLTNNSSIAKDGVYLQTRRGWIGGIVGHTQYVDITDCDCMTATIGGQGYYYGGIAGQLENSTVTSCDAVTDMSATNNKGMGGVVGRSLGASEITGCTYSGSMNNITGTTVKGVAGGLVGLLYSGELTVSTSSFKGDIRGTKMTIDNLCGEVTEGATLINDDNSLLQ